MMFGLLLFSVLPQAANQTTQLKDLGMDGDSRLYDLVCSSGKGATLFQPVGPAISEDVEPPPEDLEIVELKDLRSVAMDFLDNGGGKGEDACDFCRGKRSPASSDNPVKAIISLKNDRETAYKVYISVQNELVAAYNELRNREFSRLYPNMQMNFIEAQKIYDDPRTSIDRKLDLKPKLSVIKGMFPMKLSEAEPSKTS